MNNRFFDNLQKKLDERKPILDILNRNHCSTRNYKLFKYFILTEENDIVLKVAGFCYPHENGFSKEKMLGLIKDFPTHVKSRAAGIDFFNVYYFVLTERMNVRFTNEELRHTENEIHAEYLRWKPIHLGEQDMDPRSADIDTTKPEDNTKLEEEKHALSEKIKQLQKELNVTNVEKSLLESQYNQAELTINELKTEIERLVENKISTANVSAGKYRICKKKKTNVAKILYIMAQMNMFQTADHTPFNQETFVQELTAWLGDRIDNPKQLVSGSKNNNNNFTEIFRDLLNKAVEYLEK